MRVTERKRNTIQEMGVVKPAGCIVAKPSQNTKQHERQLSIEISKSEVNYDLLCSRQLDVM